MLSQKRGAPDRESATHKKVGKKGATSAQVERASIAGLQARGNGTTIQSDVSQVLDMERNALTRHLHANLN